MNESGLYARLKDAIGHTYFLQRVENGIGVGTPDVYFARKGTTAALQGWIELKCLQKLPVREATNIRVPFRPGQYAWFKRSQEASIAYFLLFWTPEGYFIFDRSAVRQEYTQPAFYAGCRFDSLSGGADGPHAGILGYLDGVAHTD